MQTYIILSKISHEVFEDEKDFLQLAATVSEKIKSECPDVVWKNSYVTMGRYDVIDIVEADNHDQVKKAAMIIRGWGHATTETLPATPWKQFLESL